VCTAWSALLCPAGTLPRASGNHLSHSGFLAAAIGRAQLATVFQDTPERRAATQKRMADMLAMFEFEVRTAARGRGQPGQAWTAVAASGPAAHRHESMPPVVHRWLMLLAQIRSLMRSRARGCPLAAVLGMPSKAEMHGCVICASRR
jgi:hypothetical protein